MPYACIYAGLIPLLRASQSKSRDRAFLGSECRAIAFSASFASAGSRARRGRYRAKSSRASGKSFFCTDCADKGEPGLPWHLKLGLKGHCRPSEQPAYDESNPPQNIAYAYRDEHLNEVDQGNVGRPINWEDEAPE